MNAVAIVTGGGNGIGRAVALRLAADGFALELVDLDKESARKVADAIKGRGGRAEAHGVDGTDAQQVRNVVAEVMRRHGRLDAVANIAGGSVYVKPLDELTWQEWKADLDRNLKTTFLFCREAARIMMRQGNGCIVNTSSNYGLTGAPSRTGYSAAKAAIIGFSKSLALELAPFGVRVNVVAPGPTDTPNVLAKSTPDKRLAWKALIPMGRTAQPEEIAEAFAFLIGNDSAYMAGHTLHVNGGLVMS
jgi:NAD(P)-dependent dehydrogenase (short-subunit alcohol dehydrogenase family)